MKVIRHHDECQRARPLLLVRKTKCIDHYPTIAKALEKPHSLMTIARHHVNPASLGHPPNPQ